jgi:hypothetical protein
MKPVLRSLVLLPSLAATLALCLALLATGCATSGKRSAARPSGNGPYLSDQDGASWWDARSTSSTKPKTYRR